MPEYYVATSGGPTNPGTLASPWDLQTALNGGFPANTIHPGDLIWVRGGVYNNIDTNWGMTLVGTAQAPITFRNYLGTDPINQERAIIRETNTSAAATAGATSVNGVNGSGSPTVSVHKNAGVNQGVSIGHQLTIASGPAAGVYVVTAGTTIVQNANTSVSIKPNLRGATAGGEAITLTLTPTSIDSVKFDGGQYVRFWGLELDVALAIRSISGGAICFSHFGSNNSGIKLIHCLLHDGQGNVFIDYQSNDMEVYGCLLYNAGNADVGNGDGGAHQLYIHHKNTAPRLNIERNVMFNDHGVAIQCYSTAGVRDFEEGINLLYNVVVNSGVLNSLANVGGKDATSLEIGGATETMSEITVDHNYFFNALNKGDRVIQIGFNPATVRIGANIVVTNNYGKGGGSGFGVVHFNGTLAAGGTVLFENNVFIVQPAGASWNGFATRFVDTLPAPAGWTVRNNIYYRVQGSGEPPISAFVTSAHPFGTIAQWKTDTGFTLDTSPAANPVVTLVVSIPTTKYESGRGWVLYYNHAGLSSIPFNPADFGIGVGDTFVVHDMRNVWAGMGGQAGTPVLGPLVWNGLPVNLPNTQIADPVQTGSQWGVGDETAPPATAPDFNVFLVRRTATFIAPPPPPGGSLTRQPTVSVFASEASAQAATDRITGVTGTSLTLTALPLSAGASLAGFALYKNGARVDSNRYSIAVKTVTLLDAAVPGDVFVADYWGQS
jgi:hypothetical protein